MSSSSSPPTPWIANDVQQSEIAKKELHIWPLDEHNAKLLNAVHPYGFMKSKNAMMEDDKNNNNDKNDNNDNDNNNNQTMKEYDLIAIGSGAGGLVSSKQSARRGAKSALISAHLAGGDCLNVGCVPSKALLRAMKAIMEVKRASEFGIFWNNNQNNDNNGNNNDIQIDFSTIMKRLREKRAQISPADGHAGTEGTGAHVYQGLGTFTSPNTIQVNDEIITFKKAVIATGGRPTVPQNIPGLVNAPYTTNEILFNLEVLPPRMVILGAGVVALEMAQCFATFGSRVTVLMRGQHLFASKYASMEGASILKNELQQKSGVQFISMEKVVEVTTLRDRNDKNPKELPLMKIVVSQEMLDGGPPEIIDLECECLLVATGRTANVERLNLNLANVPYELENGILVNDHSQSIGNPNVYAVGDCVANVPRLTHMSGEMAKLVVQNALFGDDWKLSSFVVPSVIYTEPEYAQAGIYSKELANSKGIDVDVYQTNMEHNDRAILEGNNVGLCSIVCSKNTDTILGVTIVADRAGEMINEVTLAMKNNIGLKAIGRNIHSYPTFGEAVMGCGISYINSHWEKLN